MNNHSHQHQYVSNAVSSSFASPVSIFTYDLPYIIRRKFCDLLDADESWHILGGQFMNLDDTQLALLGQAHRRQGSPTAELLMRLDAANVRVSDLCYHLLQLGNHRACDLIRPFEYVRKNDQTAQQHQSSIESAMIQNHDPIVSMAMTVENNVMQTNINTDWRAMDESLENPVAIDQSSDNQHCHRSNNLFDTNQLNRTTRNQQYNVDKFKPPINQPKVQYPIIHHQLAINQERYADAAFQQPMQPTVKTKLIESDGITCASGHKRGSISDHEVVDQLRLIMQIQYSELKQASDDFAFENILGNGGFASVYRGKWKGTNVAIKRLKCNLMDQALNELTILNSYRIDNILPIYGISIDGPEACLVYQFMSNGSLEDRLACLKHSKPLTWEQRAQIGEGIAKALYYLHTLRNKPLVHGDVKSANVLLDGQFVAKLGDFGLARQMFKEKIQSTDRIQVPPPVQGLDATHCTVTSIHGTSVYLPPEYLRHKILSPAVDVYSYGIVLLEMATGARAYNGKRLLVDVVEEEAKSLSLGQISYKLKDPRLEGTETTQADLKIWLELLIKLGLTCANRFKRKRPDMGTILRQFTSSDWLRQSESSMSEAKIKQTIKQPGLIEHETKIADRQVESGDVNLRRKNDAQQLQQQIQVDNLKPSVDAMIPLLTELGLDQSYS